MSILAGIAYGAWVGIMASLCGKLFFPASSRTLPVRPDIPAAGAAFTALAAFSLIPPGSLPPFFDVPWNGALFAGCLVFAAAALLRKRAVIPCLAVLVACGTFFCYAWHRGMPGSPANLGTFVSLPVWDIASVPEAGAFVLLGAGVFLSLRGFQAGRPENPVAASLCLLAAGALFVTLFLPWNVAPFLAWPDPAVAGVDFLVFWAKTLLCCLLAVRMPPRDWHARSGLALSIAGTVLLAVLSR